VVPDTIKDSTMNIPKQNLEKFFWFLNERHSITLKRQAGQPWPWTTDKILQTYRFTNVYRELDKETIWLRKSWREPYANHRNLAFAMSMFRQINWSPTLAEIGFPVTWNPERVLAIMRDRKKRGEKLYTGAYIISGGGVGSGEKWKDKSEYTVYGILDPLYKDPSPIWQAKTLKEAWEMLLFRQGFGHFIAYEVVTDLRHTRYLSNAPDIMTWANPGPGARRGIYRLLGMSIDKKKRETNLSDEEFIDVMRYLLKVSPKYLGSHMTPLEMREIEHVNCEWDKYCRVESGEGRPRSRYRPPEEFLV
jgi:5-hmdU DNA kinase, helical domain